VLVEKVQIGAPSMDVDRRRLQEVMIEMIAAGRYRPGSEVTGVEESEDRVVLVLADGTKAEGASSSAATGSTP